MKDKEYKVIKKYPGAPKIDTIISKKGRGATLQWIEDNPEEAKEYFEEVTKKYLFTTKDGINIYEGDSYWLVRSNFTLHMEMPTHSDNYGDPRPLTPFYYYEEAQKYVEENKPKYSKKEIQNALKNNFKLVTVRLDKNIDTIQHYYFDEEKFKEQLNL